MTLNRQVCFTCKPEKRMSTEAKPRLILILNQSFCYMTLFLFLSICIKKLYIFSVFSKCIKLAYLFWLLFKILENVQKVVCFNIFVLIWMI